VQSHDSQAAKLDGVVESSDMQDDFDASIARYDALRNSLQTWLVDHHGLARRDRDDDRQQQVTNPLLSALPDHLIFAAAQMPPLTTPVSLLPFSLEHSAVTFPDAGVTRGRDGGVLGITSSAAFKMLPWPSSSTR